MEDKVIWTTDEELKVENVTLKTEMQYLYKIAKSLENGVKQICKELHEINTKYEDMKMNWRIKLLEKATPWKGIHLTSRLLNTTFAEEWPGF